MVDCFLVQPSTKTFLRGGSCNPTRNLADDDRNHDEPESFVDFGLDKSVAFKQEENKRQRKNIEHRPLIQRVDESSVCDMSRCFRIRKPEPPLKQDCGNGHNQKAYPRKQCKCNVIVFPKRDAKFKDAEGIRFQEELIDLQEWQTERKVERNHRDHECDRHDRAFPSNLLSDAKWSRRCRSR